MTTQEKFASSFELNPVVNVIISQSEKQIVYKFTKKDQESLFLDSNGRMAEISIEKACQTIDAAHAKGMSVEFR